jgi:hypothetical protein
MMGESKPAIGWNALKGADAPRRTLAEFEARRESAERAAAATEPTIRRLRRDVVGLMLAYHTITEDQHRAAGEIMQVYTAITRSLFAKVASYGDAPGGGTPTADWPPSLRRAYVERYSVWRDEMGRVPAGQSNAGDLVLLVVMDNLGVRQAAGRLHMDQRTVLRVLRESLHRYAEIGEWITPIPRSSAPIRSAEFAA